MEGIDKNLMRFSKGVLKEFEKYEKEVRSDRAKVNFGWMSKEEWEEKYKDEEDEEYE